jgi:GTP cyclohydrolase II
VFLEISFVAKADFPTKFGHFQIWAFTDSDKKEHLVLSNGEIIDGAVVRLHSKCQTGDALNSKRCDCHDQLESSLKYFAKNSGLLIYLDQEGRGIGLANKIKAYSLQDQGLDTVEANLALGFCEDMRDFEVAAKILTFFKIKKIHLLTNNPFKIQDLIRHGIEVISRKSLSIKPNRFNKRYLKTKKEKMNHLL